MSDLIKHVIIPYKKLSENTLKNLLESYISREGTDYGSYELTIDDKLSKARQDLKNGHVIIIWNLIDENLQILTPFEYDKLISRQ